MRKFVSALIVAAIAISALATSVSAAPAPASTTRQFTCSGTLGRSYTQEQVTGTLDTRDHPNNVTAIQVAYNRVLITSATPHMHNAFWGGYWKQAYHLNAWALGKSGGDVYHLLLPDTQLGGTFQGMLITEFGGGAYGNWQVPLDCTAQ